MTEVLDKTGGGHLKKGNTVVERVGDGPREDGLGCVEYTDKGDARKCGSEWPNVRDTYRVRDRFTYNNVSPPYMHCTSPVSNVSNSHTKKARFLTLVELLLVLVHNIYLCN